MRQPRNRRFRQAGALRDFLIGQVRFIGPETSEHVETPRKRGHELAVTIRVDVVDQIVLTHDSPLYTAVRPPSIEMDWPVMNVFASETIQSIACTTSIGSATRRIGTRLAIMP